MRNPLKAICVSAALCTAAGCASTGGDMETTLVDTHRRVVKLDKSLDDSVRKLNETTAELVARVNETDQQSRQLQTLFEESQVKIDSVQRELKDLKTTLYRHWNLTPPSGGVGSGGGETGVGGVVIEPPASVSAAPPITAPAQTPVRAEAEPAPPPAAPAAPASRGDDGKQLYQTAQRSYANEEYTLALQQFDEYLGKFPNTDLSANAQFWKAKCLLNQGQYQASITEFEKVRSNFTSSTKVPFALHNMAVGYSRLGQTQRAIQLMEEVIENYPVSPAADQAQSDLKKLRGN